MAEVNLAKSTGAPFQKASTMDKRLKLFLWGDSGAGKTTLALQFPSPVVIDLEGGADLYGDSFKFDVIRTTSPDDVMKSVDWLLTHKHEYRTLVVDPITVYWDGLQKKWSDIFLKRKTDSKGYKYEFFDLQPKDWMTIKQEWKELIRKLIALDMNVIVTAREKTKYREGSFMVAIGETFDGEKSLPYTFDSIIHMWVNGKGKFMGYCIKDRSNKLPHEEFECSFKLFEESFGEGFLNRKAKPIEYATEAQKKQLNQFISQFAITTEQLKKRLRAYDATGFDDLTNANAKKIIVKFREALKKKEVNNGGS